MKPARRSTASGEPMPVGHDRAQGSGWRSLLGSWLPTMEQSPLTPVVIVEPRSLSDFLRPEGTGLELLVTGLSSRRSPYSIISPDFQQTARRLPHSGQQSAPIVWTPWSLLPHLTIEGIRSFLAMQVPGVPRSTRNGDAPFGDLASSWHGSDSSSVEPFWHWG